MTETSAVGAARAASAAAIAAAPVLTVASADGAPGLTLRRWLDRDAPAMAAAHADPAMRRWLLRHIDDEQQARVAIAEQRAAWEAGVRFTFAVVEHEHGTAGQRRSADTARRDPIGSVTIRRIDKRVDVAEIGYWVAPAARGRSIAVRAAEAALAWAAHLWRENPLRRFELIHTVGNEASCRVAHKLGFAFEQELAPSVKFPEPGHLHVRPW